MSIKIVEAVLDHSQATGAARFVLTVLATYANDKGECWPAINTIAKRTKFTPRYVTKLIRELENLGEIETRHSTGRRSRYRIPLNNGTGVNDRAPLNHSSPPPLNYSSETPEPLFTLTVKNHHRTVITPPLIPPAEDERENEPSGTGRSEAQDAGKGSAVASAVDAENETATDAESPAGGNSGSAGGDKPKHQSAKRGCRLPSNFWPDDTGLRVFLECNGTDIAAAVEHFADYWQARAGAGGVKLDWQATWRNWCRNAAQRYGSAGFGAGNRAQPRYREPGLENLFAAASRCGD